jgi:curli biogenesis system outer membrane secretion channel CsgG
MRTIAVLLIALTLVCVPTLAADDKDKPQQINVPMADRPMLAVVAFDDGSIQRESWWGPSWDIGKGLADILTTVMLERNRYRLVERSLLEKVIGEQDLGAGGRVDPATASKIGKLIGADYLIMGKVTTFTAEQKKAGGLIKIGGLGGLGTASSKAHVSVDLRVVDATTGEILGSYPGKADESKGSLLVAGHTSFGVIAMGSEDFNNTILGKATRNAIGSWCDNLSKAQDSGSLVLTPKHRAVMRPDGVILDVSGTTVIANCGTDKGYAVGDKVEIHKKGKELKDPDTGEVLRVMTELIGTGTITKCDAKTADIAVTITNTALTIDAGDIVKSAQ